MFAFENDSVVYKNTTTSTLLSREYRDLLVRYRGMPRVGASRYAYLQTSIEVHGVTFSPEQTSYGNSLVVYQPRSHGPTSSWLAGKIICIFLSKQISGSDGIPIGPPYLVIQPFVPLGTKDAAHDHYRKFGDSGGKLFYNREGSTVIVSLEDVLCHFACTPIQVPSINGDCIHALPLSRVSLRKNRQNSIER